MGGSGRMGWGGEGGGSGWRVGVRTNCAGDEGAESKAEEVLELAVAGVRALPCDALPVPPRDVGSQGRRLGDQNVDSCSGRMHMVLSGLASFPGRC